MENNNTEELAICTIVQNRIVKNGRIGSNKEKISLALLVFSDKYMFTVICQFLRNDEIYYLINSRLCISKLPKQVFDWEKLYEIRKPTPPPSQLGSYYDPSWTSELFRYYR